MRTRVAKKVFAGSAYAESIARPAATLRAWRPYPRDAWGRRSPREGFLFCDGGTCLDVRDEIANRGQPESASVGVQIGGVLRTIADSRDHALAA